MDSTPSKTPMRLFLGLFVAMFVVGGLVAGHYQDRLVHEEREDELIDIGPNPDANPTLFNVGLIICILGFVGIWGLIFVSGWKKRADSKKKIR